MQKKKIWIVVFLLPTIVLFVFIYLFTISLMFGTSFTEWRLASKIKFSGFENYIAIFQDEAFLKALTNTLIWIALHSTLHVMIGIGLALILAKKEFYWKFVRTVYMIPSIISGAALGMLYLCMFNPKYGAVNSFIRLLGFANFEKNWFFDFSTAFITVTLTWLPYAAVVMILVLAEFAAIPESVLESARIDGAGNIQTNFYIVIPMLRNIIGTCVILAVTSMLHKFDIIIMTTGGGPGDLTMNLPIFIYRTALQENNFSYANTAGTLLMGLGIVLVLIIGKTFRIGTPDNG